MTETKPLAGQVAVVTGSSNGIGQEYVAALAGQGADIAGGDMKPGNDTRARVEAAGCQFFHHELDVSSEASVTRFAAAVQERYDRVDILVNNAGIYPYTAFEAMSFKDWRQVIAVNLDGPFLMCKAFVPLMRAAKYGRVVNIGSAECWMAAANNLHYIASKMGVIGLTRALATEAGADNVLVNCVAPGITNTQTVQSSAAAYLEELPKQAAIKRPGEPADMAAVLLFLCSPENRFVTGQTIVCDGGLVRI